jgi:hypothetical protein
VNRSTGPYRDGNSEEVDESIATYSHNQARHGNSEVDESIAMYSHNQVRHGNSEEVDESIAMYLHNQARHDSVPTSAHTDLGNNSQQVFDTHC